MTVTISNELDTVATVEIFGVSVDDVDERTSKPRINNIETTLETRIKMVPQSGSREITIFPHKRFRSTSLSFILVQCIALVGVLIIKRFYTCSLFILEKLGLLEARFMQIRIF